MDSKISKITIVSLISGSIIGGLYTLYRRATRKLRFGGVECGGTSFCVSIAEETPTNIIERHVVPTTNPTETLTTVRKLLEKQNLSSIGIACFGPVDLDQSSSTYGYITSTPKLEWQNTNVLAFFNELKLPINFQTDVNAAALGEIKHGNHGKISSLCYVTVGTGIGVGVVVNGQAVNGLMHPEGGHIRVIRHKDDDFKGNCPFHMDCLEGLANAGALASRLKIKPSELHTVADSHPIWDMEAYYLGQLCAVLTCVVSPHVIVLGGGVLHRVSLFPKIRQETRTILNNYISVRKITEGTASYIVQSRFDSGDNRFTSAGSFGSVELARLVYSDSKCCQ